MRFTWSFMMLLCFALLLGIEVGNGNRPKRAVAGDSAGNG